jgi:methyl coenzyme M reductase subunit C-like uncharacterized protein (methanogenesis marker protein 7)
MIDPVSVLAIATSAYNAIKKGIEMGREIEDMGNQLGTWFSAVGDVKRAEEEAKDPPLFRRLVAKQSVEEQALRALMARKKIEQQERELRELIVYKWGTDAYRDMLRERTKIKDTRTRALENQRRKMKKFIQNSATIAAIASLVGIIIAFIAAIIKNLR